MHRINNKSNNLFPTRKIIEKPFIQEYNNTVYTRVRDKANFIKFNFRFHTISEQPRAPYDSEWICELLQSEVAYATQAMTIRKIRPSRTVRADIVWPLYPEQIPHAIIKNTCNT